MVIRLFDFLRDIYRKSTIGLSFIAVWTFYFLLKFFLSVKGAIDMDIPLNLLFLLFVIVPVPSAISRYRTFRFSRTILNIVLAILLLWHDSWLPPLLYSIAFIKQQGMPSFTYIASFLAGVISMSSAMYLYLGILLSISFLARRYKTVAVSLLAILIIAVPEYRKYSNLQNAGPAVEIVPASDAEIKDPAKYLESFYSSESERVIIFNKPDPASTPFDIVVLHACSLATDDLKQIGMGLESPFLKQFDYLFTNFNTVTGYSGPAVMRLLEANCGQKNHNNIQKKDLPGICLLYESLASVGYEPYISMDHDGAYADFLKTVKRLVPHNAKLITNGDLKPEAVFFDDKTLLYGDYEVLKKWYDARQASKAERAALYYNTILLHAGSHWVGEKKWYDRDTRDQYKDVFSVLTKDIDKFIALLKSSKRNTVLVFIPEHGRALSGSAFQPPDVRDIPLPKITEVPVGIKLIGPKFNNAGVRQHVISRPASYLALSWMLSRFVEKSPFGASAVSPEDLVSRVPKTDFVSEHEGRILVEIAGNYYFYGKNRKWISLTRDQLAKIPPTPDVIFTQSVRNSK